MRSTHSFLTKQVLSEPGVETVSVVLGARLKVNPSGYKECPFPMNFYNHKTNRAAASVIHSWVNTRGCTFAEGGWSTKAACVGTSPVHCDSLERPLPSPGGTQGATKTAHNQRHPTRNHLSSHKETITYLINTSLTSINIISWLCSIFFVVRGYIFWWL